MPKYSIILIYIKLAICVLLGLCIWVMPAPESVPTTGWRVFAVFVATIVSFLIRPLPMAPMVLLGLLVLAMSGTLAEPPDGEDISVTGNTIASPIPGTSDTLDVESLERPAHMATAQQDIAKLKGTKSKVARSFKACLRGFGNSTVWLVVSAFLISGAVIRTGLGKRIALTMIYGLGRTTLGLGYAIAGAELILGPFIPSNTARGGGVMAPIVNAVANSLGSTSRATPRLAGEYLVLCGAHLNLITAAMFMTGMAANSLVAEAAQEVFQIEFNWTTWLIGSIVPGILSLLLLPLFIYGIASPVLKNAQAARKKASDELKKMGVWTRAEVIMAGVFLILITLWSTSSWHGFPSGLIAMLGVLVLLFCRVQTWQEMAAESAAWDTLVWLGGLLTMSKALLDHGFISWFAASVQAYSVDFSPIAAAIMLAVVYFFSMYCFSMLTGHITAMVGAFFVVSLAMDIPPMLMIALLAYFSSLCGCITNYSSGPVIIYFGLEYVSAGRWFVIGLMVALFQMAIWLGVGLPYWKLLGWW